MRFLFLLTPFLLLCTASCDNEEPVSDDDFFLVVKEYPTATKDFWPYLQSFERESAQRGNEINLSNSGISLTYKGNDGLSEEEEPTGTCYHNPEDPNTIVINFADFNNSTRYAREKIIFHELGHCSLNRDHDDSEYSDGNCKSLMKSSVADCLLVYDAESKQAYLDELFSK